ncbi:MAG: hypothetical protein B6I20_11940 [Bacteroidetes bacterium 4572_117]|nr:MAG: hypothetical protein B6I20_11940 [Bacteroidetes bacterium 4572_117]
MVKKQNKNQGNYFSPFSTIMVFIVIMLVGFYFVPLLSVQLNPSHKANSLTVSFTSRASSGLLTEQTVTSKLEGVLSSLRGLVKIESVSEKTGGQITLEFDKSVEREKIRFECSMLIRQLYPQLPAGVSYPLILNQNTDEQTDQPLLSYTLSSGLNTFELKQYADEYIKKPLSLIKGISRVELYGITGYETIIEYNDELVYSLGISVSDIKNAINLHFTTQSLGVGFKNTNNGKKNTFGLILKNNNSIIIDLEKIPIKENSGRIIFLSEIAKIYHKQQQASSFYRINGKNTINMLIYPNKNTNTLIVAKNAKNKIKELKKKLPQNFLLSKSGDTSQYIYRELKKIAYRSLLTLLILIVFIFLAYRNLKYLLIILFNLVVNLALAFIFYYILKIEIHLYSLAGITVSLGLIIDNSIVMADSLKHGKGKGVFLAILASTLTTVASLSIIYFLDEHLRLKLSDFAAVMIINLSISVLNALFLIPALFEQWGFNKKKQKANLRYLRLVVVFSRIYEKTLILLIKRKKTAIFIIVLLFGLPVFMLPDKLESENLFAKAYNTTLGSENYKENIKPTIDKYLGGSLRLFAWYVFDNAYYGEAQETELYVYASMPPETSIKQIDGLIKFIETYLLQFNEIEQFHTYISNRQSARITIKFKKAFQNGNFPFMLKSRLVRKVIDLDAVSWNIFGVGRGFNNSKGATIPQYKVAVYGYNFDELDQQATILKNMLLKHPRIHQVDIRSNKNPYYSKKRYDNYVVGLDNWKLAAHSYSSQNVYSYLKLYGIHILPDMYLNINGENKKITIRPASAKSFDLWKFMESPIKKDPLFIKLKNVARIQKQKADESVYKENQQYRKIVEFEYTGTAKFALKYLDGVMDEYTQQLPIGYSSKLLDRFWFVLQGEKEQQYGLIFLIIVLIWIISSILFESLKQAFAVIAIIPVSYIGVFLGFYLFDFNFDQGGYASFVLLSGITVNSSIYIINNFNNLQKLAKNNNVPPLVLYLKAYNNKIFPVLLTISSTILGFTPFIIGGQNEVFWFALAIGTIGGLVFSLIGILFYLPLFMGLKKTGT